MCIVLDLKFLEMAYLEKGSLDCLVNLMKIYFIDFENILFFNSNTMVNFKVLSRVVTEEIKLFRIRFFSKIAPQIQLYGDGTVPVGSR